MTTVAVTVDVDGEAGLPDGGRGWEGRLTSRSERLYGLRRGLPRILAVLAEHEVRTTFFFPGATAQRHPGAVQDVLAAGHELGHHGHCHLRPDLIDAAAQRAEIEQGLAALEDTSGARPVGYRAPGWELTTTTLELLAEHRFEYDSSLMGDDRPYRLDAGLVELPVHWSLDDVPYFSPMADGRRLLAVWRREHELALAERRPVVFTLHPEVLGRPHRIDLMRALLDEVRSRGTRIAPLCELADSFDDAPAPRGAWTER